MRASRLLARACGAALLVGCMPALAAAQEPGWPMPVHDDQLFWKVFAEHVELAATGDDVAFAWDLHGWIGGDFNRLWLKSEGGVDEHDSELEVQALLVVIMRPRIPKWTAMLTAVVWPIIFI